MKKAIFILLGIIMLLAVSMSIGYFIYTVQFAKQSEIEMAKEEKITQNQIENENSIITNVEEEEKVTPSTQFILQKHYVQCGHTTVDYVEIPSKIVNMTQEQIQEQYQEWEIAKFSKDEVILKKEESGNCDQHYVLREKGGYIAIYWINQNGMESLKEMTGISTQYLPQEDISKLEEGIFVYGLQELNTIIEDYE